MTVERSRSKPALITPSASPPPSRSFFPQPYRIPDQASPSKRPRLASSSSHLQSHLPSASSSSTSLDQIDVHKAREASTLRLFDVWSTLADRYSRPLDEDDIIDITTGDIVKDRGVLRSSRNWDIGCFADNVEEEGEEEDEEDEEDIDELDSFTDRGGGEEPGDVPLDVDGRRVPPVTEMDPEDAKDLKQFLEAERKRREICGSEEETEDSEEEGAGEEGLDDTRFGDSVHSDCTNPSSLELGATPQVEKEDNLDAEPDRTPRRQRSVDSESDDELVNWGVDDASMIYRLPKKEDHGEDHDSDVEIIEAPALHPPPSSPRTKSIPNPKSLTKKSKQSTSKAKSSRAPKPPQSQLQTPPQSQSSFNSSTPSEDLFVPLPPVPSLPPRSLSPATSSHDDSSPTKPRPAKSHLRNSYSRSQRAATSQVVRDVLPPIPRLDLAKMAQERVAPKSSTYKPMPNSRAKENTSNLVPASDKVLDQGCQGEISEPLSCIGDKSAPRRSRSHVEVVIEQRRPFSTRTPVQDSQQASDKQERTSAKKSSKEEDLVKDPKGKGRELVVEDVQENVSIADDESDDPITILSSSPISVSKGSGRSHFVKAEDRQSSSASVLPSAKGEERLNVLESPRLRYNGVASTPSMGTRKRKRVASSSETEAIDLDNTPNPSVAVSTVHSKTAVPNEELPVSRRRKDSTGSQSSVPASPGEPESRRKSTRRSTPITRSMSRSRSRPGPSNHDRGSSPASSQEDMGEPHRHFYRAPSHFDPIHSDPPYYAYPQPPYPPHPQSHLYPPIADPRAQYIISQAMHQLSALVTGPWTPPTHGSAPYTPSHRHHPGGSGSMYSTPTHPHPYPYVYDPNLSRATLPPDSPDVPSSPIVPGGTAVRRKSLVQRSRSRGRRVSFQMEEESVDEFYSRPTGVRERESTSRDRDRSRAVVGSDVVAHEGVGKGKEKATAHLTDSCSEPEPEMPKRGRSFSRAQTPGPPIRTQSSSDTLPSGSDQSPPFSTTGRGRSRSAGSSRRRT